jgi:hypothetical protein
VYTILKKTAQVDPRPGGTITYYRIELPDGTHIGDVRHESQGRWKAFLPSDRRPCDPDTLLMQPGKSFEKYNGQKAAADRLLEWHNWSSSEKLADVTLRQRRAETERLRIRQGGLHGIVTDVEKWSEQVHTVPGVQEKMQQALPHLKAAFELMWDAYRESIPDDEREHGLHKNALTMGVLLTLGRGLHDPRNK